MMFCDCVKDMYDFKQVLKDMLELYKIVIWITHMNRICVERSEGTINQLSKHKSENNSALLRSGVQRINIDVFLNHNKIP